ncbi:MAG: hypothetical protein JWN34_2387 [Bryobacterales bacterium]|nr:hypothetical protein [Bryobacterales bacterium]
MIRRPLIFATTFVACSLPGWSQPQAAGEAAFTGSVLPVLTKYCATCHNEKLKTANINFQAFTTGAQAALSPDLWNKTLDKLVTGKMPPTGLPAPTKTEIATVTHWIEPVLARAGLRRETGPGRVLARRLNRVEYNNTIRDLLAIPYRPADEFPVDDSGYGFDNIADVLTISPMLMEKYLGAARKASQLAVFGPAYPAKPVLLSHQLAKRSYDFGVASGTEGSIAGASYLPYAMRGNLEGSFLFPVDAEYEIRFRVMNLRNANGNNFSYLDVVNGKTSATLRGNLDADGNVVPPPAAGRGGRGGGRGRGPRTPEQIQAALEKARQGAPPLKVVLTFDGKPILNDVIEGETDFGYARGELVARIPVKAGEHAMRISFPELANMEDPRAHLNIDMRRKVFADYLDVAGPFNPSQEPPASYRKLFVCGHAPGKHTTACARQILTGFTRRAWRRPAAADEIESKLRLIDVARKEGDSFEEGVRLAVEAILSSPNFLFKLERDPKPAANLAVKAAYPVSDYELAARLSYFLWSTMPDDELARAADAHTLRKPGVLDAQVRRMSADPKANNLVDNFAAQWLQLRILGRTKPDGSRFGTIDDELLGYMKTETSMFVSAIMREDRSILDFIDAPFTFLNGPLARHYGISGVDGEEFRRVSVDPVQRGGLLGQAAILTVSSYPTRTSIPVRGKWVLENLLGTPPPPPPPDVPVLKEAGLGKDVSLRERLEQHRSDPSCSGCHNMMDPIGFGLETYDAVGKWRTHDGDVKIDASGTLPGGRKFDGVAGLRQILKGQSDAFTRNLTEKLMTFALGRGLEVSDRAAVDKIVRQVAADNYRFSALVRGVVNSDAFQMRSALPPVIAGVRQ